MMRGRRIQLSLLTYQPPIILPSPSYTISRIYALKFNLEVRSKLLLGASIPQLTFFPRYVGWAVDCNLTGVDRTGWGVRLTGFIVYLRGRWPMRWR